MIGLGLRLTLKGGREAAARFVFTTAGVALAVALLFFALAGFNGLHAQDARWGWLTTQVPNSRPSVDESTSDPLWWHLVSDRFRTAEIVRVDVAATGSRSPVPPGIPRLPGPGEFYASPALARLLASVPPAQLGNRFPGRLVGTIGARGLTSPNALIAVVGHKASELRAAPSTMRVRSIEMAPRAHSYSTFLRVVLGIGAVGLLFPVLVFVATSTRLAAARREERFAALRLVGATPRQVNVIASAEAALAAIAGTLLGFALFWAVRPLVARIPFTGDPFFPSDLSLGPVSIPAVLLGVPLAAIGSSLISLRRVRLSPLGVSRHVTPRPPRVRRVVPLLVALIGLGAFAWLARRDWSARLVVAAVVACFAAIIAGLYIAGPWLTMVCARLLSQQARRDSTLIAARRLGDDPGRAFRAISGLVLAVFVGSVFTGVVSSAVARRGIQRQQVLSAGTLGAAFDSSIPAGLTSGGGVAAAGASTSAGLSPAHAGLLVTALRKLPGVRLVAPIALPPNGVGSGLLSTADFNRLSLSRNPRTGAALTVSEPGKAISVSTIDVLDGNQIGWQPVPLPAHGLGSLSLAAVLVVTDGSSVAIDTARTMIEAASPFTAAPVTIGEITASATRQSTELQRITDVGILLSLLIAGCSLAVAVAGSLVERKRPFSLLRLTGMPLASLRRVVMLEAAVPLVVAAAVSVASGLLAADLILRTVVHVSLDSPGWSYYGVLLGGLTGALAVVAATLPLLGRVTAIDSGRTE